MFHIRALLLGCFLLILPVASFAADPPVPDPPPISHTIAVADFTGADPEVGRFIAETLLTDLAQSQQMHFAERSEIRRALDELKLQSTGLVDPQQIIQLGKLVSADRLIVGSYLEADDQIIINARLLDVATGRLAEGGAGNVTGDRRNLLSLIHRLAHQFHRRVSGTDFVIDGEGAEPPVKPLPSRTTRPASASRSEMPAPVVPKPAPATPPADNNGYRVADDKGYRVHEASYNTGVPRSNTPPIVMPPVRIGVPWQRPIPSHIVPGRSYRIPLDLRPVNFPASSLPARWRIQ